MSERNARYFDGKMLEEMSFNGNDGILKPVQCHHLVQKKITVKKTMNLEMRMTHKFIIVPLYDVALPLDRDN